MTRGRTIPLIAVVATVGVVGSIAYRVLHTRRGISEAYAAWDTGTLLIEYMKEHNDRWPTSWDELLTVLHSDEGRKIPLRGAQPGDIAYARRLREMVAVDWAFDPANPNAGSPVTPISGGKFSVVWKDAGTEPDDSVLFVRACKHAAVGGPLAAQKCPRTAAVRQRRSVMPRRRLILASRIESAAAR